MTDADLSEIVHAIDAVRLDGRALVLMKTPHGSLTVNGVSVTCVSVARSICAQIEAKMPGVAALPVPMGFEVQIFNAGTF